MSSVRLRGVGGPRIGCQNWKHTSCRSPAGESMGGRHSEELVSQLIDGGTVDAALTVYGGAGNVFWAYLYLRARSICERAKTNRDPPRQIG